jgi:type II secretion system protein I
MSIFNLRSLSQNPLLRTFTKKGIKGFTLLEVLVAMAILGIAITIILQLFTTNLNAISASEDYIFAATTATAKMREILSDEKLTEGSLSELTADGYRIDISVTDALKERTENLQVQLLEITLTIHWTKGPKERSLTMRTLKVVEKQI